MKRTWIKLLWIGMLLLLMTGLVWAGGDGMPRSLVSSGGGLVSQGGINLETAVGQPVVGAVANGAVLCSGYWCGADAPPITGGMYALYLPTLSKQ